MQNELRERTKTFAKEVVLLCRQLPENREGKVIGYQLLKSATSIAANYREASRARSEAEFIAKLGIVESEADETMLWLEMIDEMEITRKEKMKELIRENDEIIAMIVSSIRTVKNKIKSAELRIPNSTISTPQSKNPKSKIVESSRAPEPVGLYPHARRVGNLLFLSGVGPRERGTKKIPGVELDGKGRILSYDIETQCHSVFKNVRAILEDAGSNWNQIVDVTVFLTNMKKDFQTYNRVYAEYFKDNRPCRTTVEVNALPTPIAIELKVIATIE